MTRGPAIYLGVDGGGTKTIARLSCLGESRSDEAPSCDGPLRCGRMSVLGSGTASGSNPYSVGWDSAVGAIGVAIERALAQAGIDSRPRAAVLAIAGCATLAARARLREELIKVQIADRVEVVPDTAPVLADATPGHPAIGLIAGTGSTAIARLANEEAVMVGGWGYLIDDGGSGYALGRDALRLLSRTEDDPKSGSCEHLRNMIMDRLGVEFLADIKPLIYQAPSPRGAVATLAPLVLQLAAEGDSDAGPIVQQGAKDLARLVKVASTKLGGAPAEVFLAGGLLQHSTHYCQLLAHSLDAQEVAITSLGLAPDAACGCAELAARL